MIWKQYLSSTKHWMFRVLICVVFAVMLSACDAVSRGPTLQDAEAFVREAETKILDLWIDAGRSAWVQNNFITEDTNALAAEANAAVMAATLELAVAAAEFNDLELEEETERKLTLLKTSLAAVAPSDSELQNELAALMTQMESVYGHVHLGW